MTQKTFAVYVRAVLTLTVVAALAVLAWWSIPAAQAQHAEPLTPMATTQPSEAKESGASAAAPAAAAPPKTSTGGDPEPRREPDPTAILRELTNKQNVAPRPVVPVNRPNLVRSTVIAPEAMPANAIRPVSNRLLPDGYRLVDRTGRLTREGDYYVFSFESRSEGEAEAPIRLLPNRLLEDMEDFSEGGTKPVVFVVSGELTEYHGVNYLLLQKLLTRPNLGNLK